MIAGAGQKRSVARPFFGIIARQIRHPSNVVQRAATGRGVSAVQNRLEDRRPAMSDLPPDFCILSNEAAALHRDSGYRSGRRDHRAASSAAVVIRLR